MLKHFSFFFSFPPLQAHPVPLGINYTAFLNKTIFRLSQTRSWKFRIVIQIDLGQKILKKEILLEFHVGPIVYCQGEAPGRKKVPSKLKAVRQELDKSLKNYL